MVNGPAFAFSGLATGMDTAGMIDSLVAVERRPIMFLERRQEDYNTITTKLSGLSSMLKNLKSAAESLDEVDEVLSSKVTSSDEDLLSARADGEAGLGTYTVDVTAKASAERTFSNSFAAADGTGLFGTGSLDITVGTGTTYNIPVGGGDTLETIAAKINSSGAAVTAAILNDGTGYRLQVQGNETGADNFITFAETGTSLGLDDPLNEVVSAGNASFTIDGFAMTSSSNTVEDAIPGVTLNLRANNTGPIIIDVQRDESALEEKVGKFVESYNAILKEINKEFTYKGEAQLGDTLSGDPTLRGLQSRLRILAGDAVAGLTGKYNSLNAIGVNFKQDGSFEFDKEEFADAIEDDLDGVVSLLAGDQDAGITGAMEIFQNTIDEYIKGGDGILSSKISGIKKRVREMDDQILDMEVRLDKFEEGLRAQFTAMEVLVAGLQQQGNQMMAMMMGTGG